MYSLHTFSYYCVLIVCGQKQKDFLPFVTYFPLPFLLFPFAPIFLASLHFLHLIPFPPSSSVFLLFSLSSPSSIFNSRSFLYLFWPAITLHPVSPFPSLSPFFLPFSPFSSCTAFHPPFSSFFSFFSLFILYYFLSLFPPTSISSFSSFFVFFFLPATNGVERDGKTDVFYLCPLSETPAQVLWTTEHFKMFPITIVE